jgi:histidinol phosphatase-like enzyme
VKKMNQTSLSDIRDCVFIVKDGVIVDDSVTNVITIKDMPIFGFSKPCISILSQYFQVIVINCSDRYHSRCENLEADFLRKLGVFVPTFYISSNSTYYDLFDRVKAHVTPDFNKSFMIGSSYEHAVIGRRMGFKETFIVKTGTRGRDSDEKNRLTALEPMPICVDNLQDATRCLQLMMSGK